MLGGQTEHTVWRRGEEMTEGTHPYLPACAVVLAALRWHLKWSLCPCGSCCCLERGCGHQWQTELTGRQIPVGAPSLVELRLSYVSPCTHEA